MYEEREFYCARTAFLCKLLYSSIPFSTLSTQQCCMDIKARVMLPCAAGAVVDGDRQRGSVHATKESLSNGS